MDPEKKPGMDQLVEPDSEEQPKVEEVIERAKELAPEIVELYKDFHTHPELGGQEVRTASKVIEYLQSQGVEVVGKNIGYPVEVEGAETIQGTGVVGLIKGKEGGPTVALRADMDALPIEEDPTHEVRSQNEKVSHACGHDVHTSALLGASKILQEMATKGEIEGDVLLLFQPSEEKTAQKQSGAVQMIKFLERAGYRDKIGAFFSQHVYRPMERGQIRLKEGVAMASSGEFDISLSSAGGHVMNSYEIPNLKEVAAAIDARLFEIFRQYREQEKGLVSSTFTSFGSKGYNVLSPSADATWVIRIPTEQYRETAKEALDQVRSVVSEEVEKHLSQSKEGSSIDVKITPRAGYRPVIHRDSELVAIADQAAKDALPNYSKHPDSDKVMFGGEDASFYHEELNHQEIPGVYLMVGGANTEKGYLGGNHHVPDFQVDPESSVDMAAIYADFAVRALDKLKKSVETEVSQ